MVYLDWKKILAITPETFGEDEKEEILESIAWYTPTSDVGRRQLAALLKVLQEVLKYKSDQVESLVGALDELAGKQGEEVARGREELLVEIDDLREQLEHQKRLEERDDGASDTQLRSEIVRLEMQNEELLSELQEREKDLVAEKTEAERLISQVARLEREKLELSRELTALQEETSERHRHSTSYSPDGSTEKVEELVEAIRQKNKHIMQLLDDIEAVDQDNKALRVKLTTARNESSEASITITNLTQKTTTLQISIDEAERKIKELKDKNKALQSQVEELIEKKAKNDRDLDEFALKLNERVEEWKRLLDVKDMEILKMKEEIEKSVSLSTMWAYANEDPKVKQREEQEISKLNKVIEELTREKNEYLCSVKELRKKNLMDESDAEETKTISHLQEVIEDFKNKLKISEEDATKQAEIISELVVQVRAYEANEFGLTEAMEKVKKLERRLIDRDSKIENLVAKCNELGIENGNMEEENIYLREKLGLSPTHVVDSSCVRRKSELNEQIIKELREQVEQLNNEILELKMKNREFKIQLETKFEMDNSKDPPLSPLHRDREEKAEEWAAQEQRYLQIVEENDALRKGMHEILHSLQSQTMGDVQAESLERLLEALDARHVSGWYHPAMRLQAQLNTVQGECRELRNQVGALKKRNIALSDESEELKAVIEEFNDKRPQTQTPPESQETKPQALKEDWESKYLELEIVLSQFKFQIEEKEAVWARERRDLVKERDSLAIQISRELDEPGSERPNSVEILRKTVEFLNFREEMLENQLDHLRSSFLNKAEESLSKIITLQKEKAQLILRIRSLEESLALKEPHEKLEALEKELDLIKSKYNSVVSLACTRKQEYEHVQQEPDETERETINLGDMQILKAKLHDAEAQLNCYGGDAVTTETFNNQISILSGKLATAEVDLNSEQKKRMALERCCESMKRVNEENKQRIADLRQQIHDLSCVNANLQEALQGVEIQLAKNAIFSDGEEKIKEVELKYETLLLENKNIEELLEMSRRQCRWMETYVESKNIEREALKGCLDSIGNEKFALAFMSHELLFEKNQVLELKRKNSDAKAVISQLLSDNTAKETKIIECANESALMKAKSSQYVKILHQLLRRIHMACKEAFLFPTLERAHKTMNEIEHERKELSERLAATKKLQETLEIKEEEMQVQLETLHELKAAFKSDSKTLVNWHNKTTESKLRETRYKRQNQYLSEEVERLGGQVKRSKEEIAHLEETAIEREREWEEKLTQLILYDSKEEKTLVSTESDETKVHELEAKISQLEQENIRLTRETEQKEAVFREKLTERVCRPKSSQRSTGSEQNTVESKADPEKKALKLTVNSLEAIMKQKEETVIRYQQLVKKSREEHGNVVRRLQNELRNVHNALAMQSKAYSRVKHANYQPAFADIQKHLNKIQELEEELTEVQGNLMRVSSQLILSQHEETKWKQAAEERASLLEETRERMEMEIDRCREEAQNYQLEAQHLRELVQGGQTQLLIDTISELQRKLSQHSEIALRPMSAKTVVTEREVPHEQHCSEEEPLRRQLKTSREANARLRDQIKALKDLKRRPSTARVSENEENLVGKIRKLEETLQLSKQHEQELQEKGLKRIRSVEEVTRWDERKRYQKTLEKLNAKLKQKEVEASVANNKLETIRGLMTKMDREKGMLEIQLKNLTDSARECSKLETLMLEKGTLEAQVAALEENLAVLRRQENGKTEAALYAKLEEQERTIASLQLATQSPQLLATELDRLKVNISSLEEQNIQLESENLTLKLNLEKVRDENDQLRCTCHRLQAQMKANKPPSSWSSPSRAHVRTSYEIQRELSKMKGDLKLTRDRLSITVERNADLEEEIQRLRSQLRLWEEKDLADSLARTNQQKMISELNEELIQVKSQLDHKVHLLDRVKILLSRAAAKEKALNEKVCALQFMVPPAEPR